MNLFPQDDGFFTTTDPYIIGEGFDSSGKKHLEIVGSWMNQISINFINPKKSEVIWKESPLASNANMQYFYNSDSLLLNYKSPHMTGVIPQTDSRWRKD